MNQPLDTRPLGKTDIRIAPIVFGTNVFGWTIDEAKSFDLLDACVDLGVNMLDTANMYSTWVPGNQGGESETIIGNWLAQSGKRDKVVLATKVGMPMGDGSSGLSRQNIIASAEASLRRLKTDHIDVYYAHQDDPDTPFEETLAAFQTLIADGKVRAIAASNHSPERLTAALDFAAANGLPAYAAHQPEYNLFDRKGYEGALESICQANDLGVTTYFSLASGFLSGKYRTREDLETSNRGAGFLEKYLNERGLAILSAIDLVAKKHDTSPATVSIAWICHRPSVTAPVASATSVQQLEQLAAAGGLALDADDMALLDEASRQ